MNVKSTPNSTVAERYAAGKALRGETSRSSHAGFEPAADRPDPITILEEQATTRLQELVPIRHGRMAVSPFTFLRGAAAVMAADLAGTPTSGLRVEACGDCHLSNFGIFATPERNLVFDLNDFDETLPAPFEWDIKRLAASFVVAGRAAGFTSKECATAVRSCVESYRTKMLTYAPVGYLDIWYSRIDVESILTSQELTSRQVKGIDSTVKKAKTRTSLGSLGKFAERANGSYRIKDAPPLIQHLDVKGLDELIASALVQMRESMAEDRRRLLDRYEFADIALKVVGVGSVGTRAFMVLLIGKGESDPLFLQIKQAQASVLEPYAGPSEYAHHGQRVVCGQRLSQAASDIFLGWVNGPQDKRIHYYFRQLRDMKGSFDPELMRPDGFTLYARVCGETLARAHARSGDAPTIAGYLGSRDTFDRAIVEFADAYADQTERDHAALLEAIRSRRIEAQEGI